MVCTHYNVPFTTRFILERGFQQSVIFKVILHHLVPDIIYTTLPLIKCNYGTNTQQGTVSLSSMLNKEFTVDLLIVVNKMSTDWPTLDFGALHH